MCDNDKIYGLHHETYYLNIESIFKDRYIKPYNSLKNYIPGFLSKMSTFFLFAFPGVYTNPVLKNTINILNKPYLQNNVKILLSKALLKRNACHINNGNFTGVFYEETYKGCDKTTNKFVDDNLHKKYKNRLEVPEVIFHDKIHIRFIEKIICQTQDIYMKLLKKIDKKYHHLLTFENLKKTIKTPLDKLCNVQIKDKNPNYCFYNLQKINKQKDLIYSHKINYLVNHPETFFENCKGWTRKQKKILYHLAGLAKKEMDKLEVYKGKKYNEKFTDVLSDENSMLYALSNHVFDTIKYNAEIR